MLPGSRLKGRKENSYDIATAVDEGKPCRPLSNSFDMEDRIESMPFTQEPTGYEKTILSDLQGAWSFLRDSVADAAGFEGWDRAIFHIDEAMSWESVRNLKRMPPLLLTIRNICMQGKAPKEVLDNIRELDEILKEVLSEFPN
jgi:hypothetical protein